MVCRGDTVLLVLRGRPPAAGEWAIPGGKVHLGETLAEAAEREIREETGVTVRAGGEPVFSFEIIDRDPHGSVRHHYVVLDLMATWVAGEPVAGDDAREARWVAFNELEQLPLNAVTRRALQQLFPDRFPGH